MISKEEQINHSFKRLEDFVQRKKNMNEQLELASQQKINMEQALDVQHSVLHNIGMEF